MKEGSSAALHPEIKSEFQSGSRDHKPVNVSGGFVSCYVDSCLCSLQTERLIIHTFVQLKGRRTCCITGTSGVFVRCMWTEEKCSDHGNKSCM